MHKLITSIFLVFLSWPLFAVEKSLYTYRVHGGAFESYIFEEINVFSNNKVSWKTLSNFPRSKNENAVGLFEVEESASTISEIIKVAQKFHGVLLANKIESNEMHEIMIVDGHEFEIGNLGSEAQAIKLLSKLRNFYREIKSKAKAVQALKLNCLPNEETKKVSCDYKNIGSEKLTTVDPLGVEASIRCLDLNGNIFVQNQGKIGDPKKMKPKMVTLKPGESFHFDVALMPQCEVQVVVKTTDMLINPEYKDVLVGELFSNFLPPLKGKK